VITTEEGAEFYVAEGLTGPLNLAKIASAGWSLEQMKKSRGRFDEIYRGSWDGKARLADQDRDGVAGEIIYPTVGMVLCQLPDIDLKHASFRAYNRWLEEFCGSAPQRLFGIGQTAVRSVNEAIDDLTDIKEKGFRGVMMPASPGTTEDYDNPVFDPLWRAAVDMEMPVSFHSLTSSRDTDALAGKAQRGPRINGFQAIVRTCQDIIGMFVFGGVFDRVPELKLVSVEADAGWAPHWMARADHAYRRHRTNFTCPELTQLPSAFVRSNVYMTFQDDWVAFKYREDIGVDRLMWGNDFPHSDSTWPHSQTLLEEHTRDLPDSERRRILRDNVCELYRLPVGDADGMLENQAASERGPTPPH
jgi:predicted TIM-barrel fold metal-dependent hydrolase